MNGPDFHDLDVRIDAAGHLPSDLNDAVVNLLNSGKVTAFDMMPLLTPLAKMRDALINIQKWSSAAQSGASAQTGLKPGQRIADVGAEEGTYSGDVDAATLTPGNLAYIANHNGDFSNKWGQVFNAKPRFPDDMGTLANTAEDPTLADGRSLADIAKK